MELTLLGSLLVCGALLDELTNLLIDLLAFK